MFYWTQFMAAIANYASPSSGEAYRDRRLTTNFELWVEIFCVPTCFHVRIPKPCLSVRPSVCLSVCPHPEKRYHHSFVNISPTLVIDTSTERSSRVLQHGNQKIRFFFQKSSKFNLTCAEELKSFKWVSTCTYMSTSGMHRRPFEGRHLVNLVKLRVLGHK